MTDEEHLAILQPLITAHDAVLTVLSFVIGTLNAHDILKFEDVAEGIEKVPTRPEVHELLVAMAAGYRNAGQAMAKGQDWRAAHLSVVPKE